MKRSLTCLLLLLSTSFVFAQTTKPKLALQRISGHAFHPAEDKMLCDPATSPITILSCEGEPATPNGPVGGAPMTWTATGSNNFYYSRIYNGLDTFQIVQAGTSNSVNTAGGDGNYTGILAIGIGTNTCLPAGTWTVQVWDVMDANGDLRPDRVGGTNNADDPIIGCFTECTYVFQPSCLPDNSPAYTATVTDNGCTTTGSISLSNFDLDRFYCTNINGFDLSYSWTGPSGFTANTTSISGLAAGTYTVVVEDFYGCTSTLTRTVSDIAPVTLDCPVIGTAPTTVGGADGSAIITILTGSGDYSITWTGPSTGSLANAVDGPNLVNNLSTGTYTFIVTDDISGCTEMCTVTIEEPPCLIDFTVMLDADGNVVITILGGFADFFLDFVGPTNMTAIGPIGPGGITIPAINFIPGDYDFFLYESVRPPSTPVPCEAFRDLTVPPVDCSDLTFTLEDLQEPNCGGIDDGLIEISFTGNFSPVIVWTGPGIDGDGDLLQDNLGPGTYSFEVFDSRNCSLMDSYTFTTPPALSMTCGAVGETLASRDDGLIGYLITGGTPPYTLTYTATDPGGTPLPPLAGLVTANQDTLRNLQAGTYNLAISDDNGCMTTCTAVVTEPNCALSATCEAINPITAGGTGSLTVTLDGNPNWTVMITGPRDSTFTTGNSSETITGLPQGDYLVEVFNSEGCVGSCFTSIVGPTCALAFSATTEAPSCAGGNDGVINLEITGAAPGLVIDWDNDAFDGMDTIRNLPAGSYTVMLSDQTGCPVAPQTIMVMDPAPMIVTLSQSFEIACNGDNTGFISAVVTDNVGNITYEWSVDTFPDSPTANGVAAGTYHVLATDENGCTARDTIIVDQPELLMFACSAVGESSAGSMDGTITVSFSGGGAGAGDVVQLSGDLGIHDITAGADSVFTNLGPGTYNLTVTNAAGCTDQCTAIVSQGGCDIVVTAVPTQPDCDNALGSATAQVTNPNGMVTYLWSNDSTTATISDLIPGDYSVTVTDALGCEALDEVTILPFTAFPMFNFLNATDVCDDNCVNVQFNVMGVAPFEIEFNVERASVILPYSFTVLAEGDGTQLLCPGDFVGVPDFRDVTLQLTRIVDANGCSQELTDLIDIFVFPAAISTLDTTICEGRELNYFGEIFNTARTTGDVVLPIPSPNGCDSTVTVNLSFFPAATGVLDTMACFGEDVIYEGEVFNAARTTDDVVISTPSVNGCDSTVTVTLSFFPAALGTLDTTICVGTELNYFGEIFDAGRTTDDVVIPTPSVNGCDSTVTVNLSFFPVAVGTLDTTICVGTELNYFGEVFNAARTTDDVVVPTPSVNGCDSTVTVNLSFFPAILGTLDTTICVGTELNYFGEIFNAARTMDDVVIPTPSVNGCDSTVSVNLTFFAPAVSALDTTICAGTQLNFFGEIFDDNRTMGDVVVPTPSFNGCDSTVMVNLSFFPQAAGMIDTTICAGTTFNYAGRSFSTAVNAELVTIPEPTANGCDSIVSVTVRVEEVPTVTLSGDGIICAGGELDITLNYDGSGTAMVVLSSDPGEVISIPSGTTTIQRLVAPGTSVRIDNATNEGNCPPVISGTISVQETDLRVSIDVMSGDGVFAVSCAEGSDGEVIALGEGGAEPYAFSWSTGTDGPRLEGLGAGRYNVVLTSARGCETDALVVLSSPDAMVAAIAEVSANCLDTLPSLIIRDIQGGVGPYLYRTDDGAFQPIPVFPDTLAVDVGRTNLALEDVNGCLLERSFDLEGPPSSDVVISPNQAIITQGDSVELTVITDLNIAGFLLTPGSEELIPGNSVFVGPLESTTYEIFVVDSAGCTADATVDVIIDDFVPVYAPNAFSPNGDGRNELFRIFGRSTVVSFRNFNVFNRWGHLVYVLEGPIDPQDTNWGWDGRNEQGIIHEPAVYVYSIEVELADGRMVTIKSDMVLMR
ncbi:MAG: gliding motility-associated C-terminal domain-containing protein [Lewinella sp.]